MVQAAAGTQKRAWRMAIIFAVLIVGFLGSLTWAYTIPQERIIEHADIAVDTFTDEGVYGYPLLDHMALAVDNYTDALMIDTAIVDPSEDALEAALAARNHPERQPNATISGLESTLEGRLHERQMYAHYWHGYQALLRPALATFTYQQIRYINSIGLTVLFAALALLLTRVSGVRMAVALIVSLIMVGGFVVPLSVQFSAVFYVMGLTVVAAVLLRERGLLSRVDIELFFAVGMITAFLDLLTAPLLTVTMPLAVLLALDAEKHPERPLRDAAILAVRVGAAWAAGYVLSWVTKWMIATIVFQEDIVAVATDQLLLRTGVSERELDLVSVTLRPIANLFPVFDQSNRLVPVAIAVTAVVTLLLVLAVLPKAARRMAFDAFRRYSRVLLVVPLPYLWFLFASNHTSIHHWYAYRIQAPAVFAILFFVACTGSVILAALLDWARLRASRATTQLTHL